ncbi:6-bladed beta-propeller [Algoriphagus yeomjeoni]|uniref:6-bladed beta-propeller protein n=1 Tax=Algoriphagus yeomjeoni TaxID=291403 RepID=A0A327PJB3_9BACT|nr:6-bladed beta-propeller [Algoriphagus yeomjeoni]RAI91461.1 6-bladed beta-propeller protein [Algoriphagus yeomjeoni]
MKKLRLFLFCLLSGFFVACSSSDKNNSEESIDGLEIIKVDLSETREGKLSEFFEPEIEYIWLKDDVEDGLLGRELSQIFFHEDRIYVMDIFGCKCIQIFDRSGKYLNKLRSYGEGPGQYLDFDGALVRNEEIMLVGVFPRKLMWFDLKGGFLREQKVSERFGAAVYSDREKRYYLFNRASEAGQFFIESVNESFEDTVKAVPFDPELYYGSYSNRNSLKSFNEHIYFGQPFQDTIYIANEGEFIPKLVFDFGKYGQSQEEMIKNEENLDPLQELEFINNRAKLYLSTIWYVTDSQLYLSASHEKKSYKIFYTRDDRKTHIIEGELVNDLNESPHRNIFYHQLSEGKVGYTIPGKTLFKSLQQKKADLGQEGFEEYVRGKGKNFAQTAFAAKDSENPVLIVYTVKK